MDVTLVRDGLYGGALLLLFIWWIRRTQAAQEKRDGIYQKERESFMSHLVHKDEVNTQVIGQFTDTLNDMRSSMMSESRAVTEAINKMALSVSELAKEVRGTEPDVLKMPRVRGGR